MCCSTHAFEQLVIDSAVNDQQGRYSDHATRGHRQVDCLQASFVSLRRQENKKPLTAMCAAKGFIGLAK
ncbi:MAG: hypothetical protein JWM11_3137 [Planctomycetaceae bacterium]|nr:hypothetical protein [Planctomycetaceae bacterium]